MIISSPDLQALLQARLATPHSVLGMHPVTTGKSKGVVVRAFLKNAVACEVVEDKKDGKAWPLELNSPAGFFEGVIPGKSEVFPYRLRVTNGNGEVRQFADGYSFLPTLSDQDLYLFNEGTELRIHEKLGANLRTINGVKGVSFAVWAPSASRVSVVGNFNQWDGRYHPMRTLGSSGVWELFIPGLQQGDLYKYEIRDQGSNLHLKTDPYGTFFEGPPNNASVVCDVGHFSWNDDAWIKRRQDEASNLDRPISVYEVHLGSWKRKLEDNNRPLNYRELGPLLADYCVEMGFTHVEVMPLAEHPFDGSWGYQVTGFFAPTHRFGSAEDFAWFVDHLHQKNIGIIMDWVPAHFPRDSFALAEFDGSHLYEHADPRQGAHMDWGTLIFNYGRNEVRCFLVASALAWIDRYHLDGLRVDAVASMLYLDYSRKAGEWIPNKFGGRENIEAIEFLRRVNDVVHQAYPGVVMIAEESTSFDKVSRPTSDGGLGFDYKWNMGWMHDTLRYFSNEGINRKWHQNDLTFGMLYQYAENFVTVFSHDEVVHGKASMLYKMGAWHIPEKAANLRALYAHMWAYPGKKLLFMGCEFAQAHEWNHSQSLDWHLTQYLDHEGVRRLVKDLNHLYVSEPVLSRNDFNPHGFRWVNAGDTEANIISYVRSDVFEQDIFLVIGHYGGAHREYRFGVPRAGLWREVINTNSEYYGGNGAGNGGGRTTDEEGRDGYSYSLNVVLPPTTTVIFKWSSGQ